MTDFVVSAVHGPPKQPLSVPGDPPVQADQRCFAQALLNPPPPAAALQRTVERRSKLLR